MPPARERVSFPRSRADNHHNAEQAGNSFFLNIGTFCSKQAVCKTSVERHVNLRLRCILMFLFFDTSSSGGHGKCSNGRQMNCTSRLKRRRQLIEATQYLLDGTPPPTTTTTTGRKPKREKDRWRREMKQYLCQSTNQPIPLSQERKKGAAAVTVLTLTAVHTYRTYMYNQQAVSSRPMKKIKTKRKKKENKRNVHFPFPWRELLKYLVQYPLICTTSSCTVGKSGSIGSNLNQRFWVLLVPCLQVGT